MTATGDMAPYSRHGLAYAALNPAGLSTDPNCEKPNSLRQPCQIHPAVGSRMHYRSHLAVGDNSGVGRVAIHFAGDGNGGSAKVLDKYRVPRLARGEHKNHIPGWSQGDKRCPGLLSGESDSACAHPSDRKSTRL